MFYYNDVLYFQLNLGISPTCEQYYRQQGYDFKLSNGRIVLVRRTPRSTRHRRQEQVGQLKHFLYLLILELLPACPIRLSSSVLRLSDVSFYHTAQQHPYGPRSPSADHSPSENGWPASHLDWTRTGQGAGRGRAQVHCGQSPNINGLPACDPL